MIALCDGMGQGESVRMPSRIAPVGTAVLIAWAALTPALAYTASGDRLFPATMVLPQLGPGDELYTNYNTLPLNGGGGAPTRAGSLTTTYMKSITDRFALSIEEGWTRLDAGPAGRQYGWQNLDGELKFQAYNNLDHEFQINLGLDRETGGTGAVRVGASPSGATTPRVYFGKGLGDLDIGFLRPLAVTGLAGVQIADSAPRPDVAVAGLVVEYSIPYLESKVASLDLPDWARRLTPMTEVSFSAPAGTSFGARATALIAPGISYAGDGWELGIEALLPMTRATGRGIGVTAQFHLSLDYLFADSVLGRPLVPGR